MTCASSARVETPPPQLDASSADSERVEEPAEFAPVFVEAPPTGTTLEQEPSPSEASVAAPEPEPEPQPLPEGMSEEQLEKRAQELYIKGLVEYRAGRYTEALGFFEHAFTLVPKPELAYNVAQTHEKLGNRREACAAYLRVIRVSERSTQTRVNAELRHGQLGCQ